MKDIILAGLAKQLKSAELELEEAITNSDEYRYHNPKLRGSPRRIDLAANEAIRTITWKLEEYLQVKQSIEAVRKAKDAQDLSALMSLVQPLTPAQRLREIAELSDGYEAEEIGALFQPGIEAFYRKLVDLVEEK